MDRENLGHCAQLVYVRDTYRVSNGRTSGEMHTEIGWDYPREYGFVVSADPILLRNVRLALALISEYGATDGAHHKQWILDQVVRALTAEPGEYEGNPRGYLKWRHLQERGGGAWDEGVAP